MNQQTTVVKTIIQSLLFVTLAFVFISSAKAQSQAYTPVPVSTDSLRKANPNLDKPDKNLIYEVVEKMPEFPGGESALMSFISSNLHYPVIAQENGIQGMVYVRFVVTKFGNVDNVEVIRSLDPACDKEAVRVIGLLPQWIPGTQHGANVSVYYTLPIKYKLIDDRKPTKTGTNSATFQPLYIVDGKEVNKAELDLIDRSRIKEVNVIKAASALTAYGDKGKNGVVIITLKKATSILCVDSVNSTQQKENQAYDVVEQMPEYPGGDMGLFRFVSSNLKYPVEAQKAKIQGTVYVRFVVNKQGKVEKAEIIRSLSPDCDRETLRVINMMPVWKPGMQKGQTVSVWYTLPIKFKLD